MNREKLVQYQDLKKEIAELEKKLNKLRGKRVSDKVQASNHEFPYQPLSVKIYGYDSKSTKKTQGMLTKRYKKCQKLHYQIETFISQIPDSRTRLIFEMRYIDGCSWLQISRKFGSRNESYARMVHDRYLEKL